MTTKIGWNASYIALKTLTTKEILRFLRIWSQTLVPPAITMTLYFLIFGKFIGSQIHHIKGVSYIQYIVPGLVMMSIMTNAYANTASSFFLTKFNKSIEEMLVSPMPTVVMLLGFTVGGALRGVLVGLMVTLVALFFTSVPVFHPLIIIITAFCAALVFSLGGLINAIYAKRFDDISFIPTFVLTPLTYLGGVFYSLDQLPHFWRTLSILNPIFTIVDTFRYGLIGVHDLNVYIGFSMVIVSFIVLFTWALFLLKHGVGIKV